LRRRKARGPGGKLNGELPLGQRMFIAAK